MNWINLLLSTKGRINRKAFMIGLLPILLLVVLLALYLRLLTGILPNWADLVIPILIALEALFFFLNLSAKRLHDIGHSTFFLLLLVSPLFVAAGFFLQQKYFPLQSYEGAVVIYTMLISLGLIAFFWMLIEMFFRRSEEQSNKYGPPPSTGTS